MTILISDKVAPKLLESVGINTKGCSSLSLDFDPGGAVTMTVTFVISNEMARQIGYVLAEEAFKS